MPPDSGADTRDQGRILYGRRRGRRLRRGQQRLIEERLPEIEIAPPTPGGTLEPADLFGRPVDGLWLEVGFGAGEHLVAQARANPAVGVIGCEPFLTGVARLLAALDADGLDNVRILRDDARLLLDCLPERCLDRAFVLFPDPWPKTRHHRRRFVCLPVLRRLASLLKPGAELRVATDHPDYLVWILEHVRASGAFEWTAKRPADWRARPPDWPGTRYEAKAVAEGRRCAFLSYRRI